VHLYQLVILEALGDTLASVIDMLLLKVVASKTTWWCLLRSLRKGCGEAMVVIVRGSLLPHRSGKGDASGTEVMSDSLSTWLKDQAMS
jgi:hypothetical protein